MSSLLATRTARRRSIAFTVLLAVSLVLMAFSSNPAVRELQSGVGFAFRPIQGALDEVAGGDRVDRQRHRRDRPAAGRQRGAAPGEREPRGRPGAVGRGPPRERDPHRRCSSSRPGSTTRPSPPAVISRDSSEFRRVIGLSKGSNDGIEEGDVVVVGGGALAGRVTRGRSGQLDGRAAHGRDLDGHRAARVDRGDGLRSSASSAACSSWSRSTPARSSPRATRS